MFPYTLDHFYVNFKKNNENDCIKLVYRL